MAAGVRPALDGRARPVHLHVRASDRRRAARQPGGPLRPQARVLRGRRAPARRRHPGGLCAGLLQLLGAALPVRRRHRGDAVLLVRAQ